MADILTDAEIDMLLDEVGDIPDNYFQDTRIYRHRETGAEIFGVTCLTIKMIEAEFPGVLFINAFAAQACMSEALFNQTYEMVTRDELSTRNQMYIERVDRVDKKEKNDK